MDPESLEAISWLVGLAVAIATLGLLLTGRSNAKRGPAPERRRPSLFDGPLGAPLFQHLVETADPETSALCANFANFSVALAGYDKVLARKLARMAGAIGVYDPSAVEQFRIVLRDDRVSAALLTVRHALDEMLDLYGDASAGAAELIFAAYFSCIDGLREVGSDFAGWYAESRHVVAMTSCEVRKRAERAAG